MDDHLTTRRAFLKAAPVLGAALVAAPAALASPAPVLDLQGWLDTARAEDVVLYHLTHLAQAMEQANGSGSFRASLFPKSNIAVVTLWDAKGNGVWVKPDADDEGTPVFHVDDGSPLLADDVTGTTAFADWQAAKGGRR